MAYDEGLAQRLRETFETRGDFTEKKMFGGICYMVNDYMCCGIVGEEIMARLGPNNYEACLAREYAREMDFTGKSMKGMVYVAVEGIEEDDDLAEWVDLAIDFVRTLPPKTPKPKKKK